MQSDLFLQDDGRMWGIIGRDNLPIHVVRFAIDRETALKLRAFLWDIIGGPPPGWIQFDDDGLTAMVEWSVVYKRLRCFLVCAARTTS
jgi:hypothetical protein